MLRFCIFQLYRFRRMFRRFAIYLRARYYGNLFETCGRPWPRIGEGVVISYPQHVRCGGGMSLNPYCYLDAKGGIEFGENVAVSYGSKFITGTLMPDENGNITHEHVRRKITIGNNVWIGSGVTVLPGVTIGDNVIVGAGAIVTKDLEGGHIYIGTPAKPIRDLAAPPNIPVQK